MPVASDLGVDDVLDVLSNVYHLDGKERGDEYDMLCPNPAHPERDPSCSVNLETGLWKCLSCGTAGDLVILGTYVLGESYDYVLEMLKPNTVESLVSTIQRKLSKAVVLRPRATRMKELPGPYADGPLDELAERGFTLATLRKWGVRYVESQRLEGKKGEFVINHSLAIPIRDARARLLAWCYRRTNNSPTWQPRYMYTPEAQLSELWGGLQLHAHAKEIVIAEGTTDAMTLDQLGYPALALLGSEMGERKIRLLQNYRSVVLFGDYDQAGIRSVHRIGTAIGDRTRVRIARYSSRAVSLVRHAAADLTAKVDPNTLSPVDLELAVETAVPWTTWLQMNIDSGTRIG